MIQDTLKQLVFHSVKLLGEALQEIHGKKLFQEIEDLRVKMKSVRGGEASLVQQTLDEVYESLKRNGSEELHHKAKAFALMLELINTCEAAYRSHRLKKYQVEIEKKPEAIIYVFTSHPTESRSHNFLKLMTKVEDLLMEALDLDFDAVRERLFYLLKIAVRLSLANNRRPQVRDEMEQVFHTVLSPHILSEQIALNKKDLNVSFRTWVGGDKDGHPKVGSSTMLESWQLSRKKLIEFILIEMKVFEEELSLVPEGGIVRKELLSLKSSLLSLKKIQKGDGKKVQIFKNKLAKLHQVAEKHSLSSPFISNIEKLIWYYPALVLPLEIREDSELIRESLKDRKQPIVKMLATLKSVSQGMDPKWYVRGFVISMCQTTEDMLAAISITERELGSYAIPVVPLFENEKGLLNSTSILEGTFKKYPVLQEHKKKWGTRYEVMVGYSDSSKENGVLPARLMIEQGLFRLEEFLLKKNLKPVFFHGSGGSTSRGGGSVLEQISWWPQSALNIFKVTIQGEMVQRNFNNPLIMRSQVGKVVEGFSHCCPVSTPLEPAVATFADRIQDAYRTLVSDNTFQELTASATPYDYLNLLKIGSRPAKRSTKGTFSLRAIPWILCWTQTRLLLPVWWGTGVAWNTLSDEEKKSVKDFYRRSPLMQSYVKNLGFTLAKIELGVWNFHLEHADMEVHEKERWRRIITTDLELSMNFFKEISGEENFTWFRPWLGESIYFRSSMIHPLNVIQKIALERKDNTLLRETVTGIACGMLTTG
ncbi:MAG: phosphoenolpyruvate carboxylase [Bacteriovoracia bacterium]